MKKTLLTAAAFATISALVVLSSCSKSNNTPNANVMVVHTSPDAPAVDVYVNNSKAVTALSYLSNTAYLSVASGTTNVQVDPTGTTTPVITANLTLSGGANYSIFAIDSVSDIQPLVTVDTLSIPSGGTAGFRVIHLCPNAPAVDVVDSASGATLVSNLSFKGYTSFLPAAAGTYTFYVRVHGTSINALTVSGVAVSAGHLYTVFARGFLGSTGSQALGTTILVNK